MTCPKPLYIAQTDSTNSHLAELCDHESIEELSCIYTSYQTEGRGQRGNTWESEAGTNLLFSVVMYPRFIEINEQFILAEIIALSIRDVLSMYTGDITIKWPNDIYWKDKKICGTLTENDLMGTTISRCISGSGINLNQKKFKSNAPNPISLSQITGKEYEMETILLQIMNRLSLYYESLKMGARTIIMETYKNALYRRYGYYTYKDTSTHETFEGKFVDIEPIGRLVLQDKEGNTRKYMFKEVEFIL